MTIREWIRERELSGVTMFTFEEVMGLFPHLSRQVVLNALARLKRDRVICSPYKSFYVTLAPQYVLRGMVPPTYYVDELMNRFGRNYYFGLLSAASFWGASHQRAQTDFVVLSPPRMTLSFSDRRRIKWIYRPKIPQAFLKERNTESGVMHYSNAELTALDLVQYEQYAGGLSVVATVLAELLEATDFVHASEGVFTVAKDSTIQRLGYLVEVVVGDERQGEILHHEWVRRCPAPHYIPLSLRSKRSTAVRDERWKILVNAEVEVDEL